MLKLDSWSVSRGDNLKKIRLSVYIVNLFHLVAVAIYLLGKDYSKSKDPHLQAYVKLKWKLITTWFNLLHGTYLLVSIVCEWYIMKPKGQPKYISLMDKSRNFVFTSIIAPVTTFSDLLFWSIYIRDKSMVMPLSAEKYVSIWNQHSLHTVSLLFVLFDLICVPRKRPGDMRAGIIALTSFIIIYACVCCHSMWNGEYLYPFLRTFSMVRFFLNTLYVYIANIFCYIGQWTIVGIVWGQPEQKIKSIY